MSSAKMILVKSSDDETFRVEEAVARQGQIIKCMIKDKCTDPYIPIINVNGDTLSNIIVYREKHLESSDKDMEVFDAGFVQVDDGTLYDLINAVNYPNIQSQLDLACQAVADNIKGKTPEQIRDYLRIENDLTPEEMEEIRRENAWAFEGED
ncbi:hypothetical protein ACH5RR_001740 [Cinchona calisaya]|uniref:SKP1-like protein n=1 Tax=Cinchona calisaya TaxID=153742 RepID=A0ABD3B4I8_9GENT